MSFVLAIIAWADTPRTDEAINDGIEWHLEPEHQAIWTDVKRPRFAGGMRLVARMVGAKVLVLTGQLAGADPREDDPIERDGRVLHYRYDVRWDERPSSWIAVEKLGPPFSQPTRSTRFISRDDFLRAYRALHGTDPPRQLPTA